MCFSTELYHSSFVVEIWSENETQILWQIRNSLANFFNQFDFRLRYRLLHTGKMSVDFFNSFVYHCNYLTVWVMIVNMACFAQWADRKSSWLVLYIVGTWYSNCASDRDSHRQVCGSVVDDDCHYYLTSFNRTFRLNRDQQPKLQDISMTRRSQAYD